MANSEIRTALQLVREAEEAVRQGLAGKISEEERTLLTNALDTLQDMDEELVVLDLEAGAERLKQLAARMSKLNQRVKKDIGRLKAVVAAVDSVAKAIDGLAKAFGILGKAGLL